MIGFALTIVEDVYQRREKVRLRLLEQAERSHTPHPFNGWETGTSIYPSSNDGEYDLFELEGLLFALLLFILLLSVLAFFQTLKEGFTKGSPTLKSLGISYLEISKPNTQSFLD